MGVRRRLGGVLYVSITMNQRMSLHHAGLVLLVLGFAVKTIDLIQANLPTVTSPAILDHFVESASLGKRTKRVEVDSALAWTDTRILVQAGQRVHISVVNSPQFIGPQGHVVPEDPSFSATRRLLWIAPQDVWALEARVGTGAWAFIGRHGSLRTMAPGYLCLRNYRDDFGRQHTLLPAEVWISWRE